MYNLGLMYLNGQGGAQDLAQAREWFQKAANGGHANAMYQLGLLYYQGHGVAQDYAKASAWLEKAVDAGYADAKPVLKLIELLVDSPDA
jgi:TPR repeat protein